MRIFSPDAINEIKENHSGLYVMAVICGVGLFFVILITFGLLRIAIELAIKHYYYAGAIIGIILFLKIRSRNKKVKFRMQQENRGSYN